MGGVSLGMGADSAGRVGKENGIACAALFWGAQVLRSQHLVLLNGRNS